MRESAGVRDVLGSTFHRSGARARGHFRHARRPFKPLLFQFLDSVHQYLFFQLIFQPFYLFLDSILRYLFFQLIFQPLLWEIQMIDLAEILPFAACFLIM